MADFAIPKSGVAYIYYGCLVSQVDTKLFKSVPTIAAGDFKVSIDGGAFANLTTLPTNTPGTFAVKFSLSAAEMTGDNILVVASDAAGAEWCDQCWNIQTAPRGIADLAYPATSGRSMVVDAAGLVDANTVKLGPTGTGTAQTARDVGGNVDVATSTRMATYTQPTGFLAATFPAGTVANTTNITAGVITTTTNLTNAATVGDLTAVMKTSVTTAATAATPIAASVTANVNADVKKINAITIVGNGSTIPFNV